MSHPTMRHRTTAALFLGAYVVSATGCTSWHNQQGEVASIVAPAPKTAPVTPTASAGVPGLSQEQPVHAAQPKVVREIRIKTATGGTTELRYPRVANDSLFGLVGKSDTETGFPVGEVTSVQTKGSNAGGTVLLVLGVTTLAFGALLAATAMSLCDGSLGC